MIDVTTKAGARAAELMERELVLWLTTVTPAGQPQAWKHLIVCAEGQPAEGHGRSAAVKRSAQ